MEDAQEAVSNVLERLATTLAPGNCQAHLADLPQDADVVRVEPRPERARRPHTYLSAA